MFQVDSLCMKHHCLWKEFVDTVTEKSSKNVAAMLSTLPSHQSPKIMGHSPRANVLDKEADSTRNQESVLLRVPSNKNKLLISKLMDFGHKVLIARGGVKAFQSGQTSNRTQIVCTKISQQQELCFNHYYQTDTTTAVDSKTYIFHNFVQYDKIKEVVSR